MPIMQKKESQEVKNVEKVNPIWWVETSESISRHFQFDPDGHLSVSLFPFLGLFYLCNSILHTFRKRGLLD